MDPYLTTEQEQVIAMAREAIHDCVRSTGDYPRRGFISDCAAGRFSFGATHVTIINVRFDLNYLLPGVSVAVSAS